MVRSLDHGRSNVALRRMFWVQHLTTNRGSALRDETDIEVSLCRLKPTTSHCMPMKVLKCKKVLLSPLSGEFLTLFQCASVLPNSREDHKSFKFPRDCNITDSLDPLTFACEGVQLMLSGGMIKGASRFELGYLPLTT